MHARVRVESIRFDPLNDPAKTVQEGRSARHDLQLQVGVVLYGAHHALDAAVICA